MTATKFMKQKGADKKQKDSKPDASSLIDTLKALKRSLEKKQQLPNEVFEKFKETSAVLSSLLPKTTDKSVFEIDDLLYSNEDKHPPSSSRSKDSNEFLISKCIDPFHYIFCCLELEHKLAPCRIMDSTYLQLIEHSSGILLTSKHRRFNAMKYISHIIANKSVSNICRALKFLKVCLSRHKQLINAEIKQDINVFKTFVFLSNIKNIPKGKQPRTKRITSWLFKQSSNIFGKLKLESNDESLKDTLKLFRKLDGNVYDKDYVKCVQNIGIKHLQINCFYKYFSTTENEEEETQRAKDFLEGLNGATQDPSEIIGVCSGICKEIDLGDIEFLDCCNYPEQLMRLVDKYHSNDVKSNNLSTDVDALNDLQESHDLENECDFTFQKFFVYDEFLKYLYLQSKIYNILKGLTKTDKNSEGWDGRIFRNSSCFVNKFLNSRLRTPSKCGELPWWFHTTLSKCPFLFLSERHENMMEDLIKMLKGEEIDDISLERLLFAIKSSCLVR